jgi:tRNA(adenine34) deaminase
MNGIFETKVQEQVERLQTHSLENIQAEVAEKRTAWVRDHRPDLIGQTLTPRQAYELLFFEYMGLSAVDLPIDAETERKIVWRSQNPCPTLEACQALHMDTRRVCREAYEGSTQAFLSQIDPRLRFGRSYDLIRPYSSYCLEWITLEETV